MSEKREVHKSFRLTRKELKELDEILEKDKKSSIETDAQILLRWSSLVKKGKLESTCSELQVSECEEYHIARDIFNLLNELWDHELTTYNGREKDAQKLIDEKLRELIESAIQRKKRQPSEQWPDYQCPFKKVIDDQQALCLKDAPNKRHSITASDCWACLKRRKKIRLESHIHTANGLKPTEDWMEILKGGKNRGWMR